MNILRASYLLAKDRLSDGHRVLQRYFNYNYLLRSN